MLEKLCAVCNEVTPMRARNVVRHETVSKSGEHGYIKSNYTN